MTKRRVTLAVFAGALVLALLSTLVFHKGIAIAYHRHAMLYSWEKIRQVGPQGNQDPWIASHEHHRDALVESGYLAHREFLLTCKPPQTSVVWRSLWKDFPEMIAESPGCLCVQMQTTQYGHAENKIMVWDRPERMPAWEAAIRKYDVPVDTPSTQSF